MWIRNVLAMPGRVAEILTLTQENKKDMSQLSDAIAANTQSLGDVQIALATLATDQAKAFTDLLAKINAGGQVTPEDIAALADQNQKLHDAIAAIRTQDDAAKAADPG